MKAINGFLNMGDSYKMSAEESKRGFLVDRLLPRIGLSIFGAKPKTGKSCITRQLAVAVAQGQDSFLGRSLQQGGVLYYAIEGGGEIMEHFDLLGAQADDPLLIRRGRVDKQTAFADLEGTLEANPETVLVVIDTYMKFAHIIKDGDYVQNNNALQAFAEIATKYGIHVTLLHHLKKHGVEDSIDGLLGSTAIAGGVDTVLFMRKNSAGVRNISTSLRWGVDVPESQLVWNAENKAVSLGQTSDELLESSAVATRKRIEDELWLYISQQPNSTAQAILEAVRGNVGMKKQILRSLIDRGGLLIQSGDGVKGSPYTYRCIVQTEDAPAPVTMPALAPATPNIHFQRVDLR